MKGHRDGYGDLAHECPPSVGPDDLFLGIKASRGRAVTLGEHFALQLDGVGGGLYALFRHLLIAWLVRWLMSYTPVVAKQCSVERVSAHWGLIARRE